jgi:hypothetical protein
LWCSELAWTALPTFLQAKLLEVHRNTEELRRAGRIERVVLAVNRSDYMLDEPSNTLLQVHKHVHIL